MVTDQQIRRLMKLRKKEKTLTMAAAKAGMARPYGTQVLEVWEAAQRVSAGADLENTTGSLRIGVAGS